MCYNKNMFATGLFICFQNMKIIEDKGMHLILAFIVLCMYPGVVFLRKNIGNTYENKKKRQKKKHRKNEASTASLQINHDINQPAAPELWLPTQLLLRALNPQAPRQQALALAVVFHGDLGSAKNAGSSWKITVVP